MIAEVAMLILAVVGILSILRFIIFKFISFKEEKFNLIIPVFKEDEEVFRRIENLREFLEFSGIHKKCTVVIINYGADDSFCNNIKDYFSNYITLKILNSNEQAELIFKELHT